MRESRWVGSVTALSSAQPPVNSPEWLKKLLQEKCHFHNVRDFQLKHGLELADSKDVFLVIAPGMGKTTVMLAPLLAAQARDQPGIGLIVVPTKALGVQLMI